MISITELAKLFDTTIRTIRYYEEIGLIDKASRIKGRRYFKEKETIYKMKEIYFLKSLGLKLGDIEATISNPLYIKPILLNIRLGLIYIEIDKLKDEANLIRSQLDCYSWEEVKIQGDDVLDKSRRYYHELYSSVQIVRKKENINMKDAVKFVQSYKVWQEKNRN